MALNCHWFVAALNPSQVQPAMYGFLVQYQVFDTATGGFRTLADGTVDTGITVNVSLPTSQSAVQTAVNTAIQAAETGLPGLTFVPLVF